MLFHPAHAYSPR